ncbi:MAG: type III pantothenate kinase [Gammaproteobacteria bacterium]|nr:type III pantothenate kinase [Gammaproteobacteria bacterium]
MSGRLIVDLGSRGIAWRGVGEPGGAAHDNAPGKCLAQAFDAALRPDEVVVGSVASEAVNQNLRAWCRENWQLVPRELTPSAEARGVRNAYRDPEQLGVDRWAALVAAHRRYGGAALIADCGTAVTVDYLAGDGRHVGGLIAPGIGLMRDALARGTRLDPVSVHAPTPRLLGDDTELCIAGGVLAAVTGMLRYAADKVAARYGAPQVFLITGGDAATVQARLGSEWQLAPFLVLDGLEWLAEKPR